MPHISPRRGLTACALAAAAALTAALPAWANSGPFYTYNVKGYSLYGGGTVTITGPSADVCDKDRDGHSAVLRYTTGSKTRYVVASKGAGTCVEHNLSASIGSGTKYTFRICLADNATAGGKPMKIKSASCSASHTERT